MKEGQKRVKNDDFEQVEKCKTCGNLFWAISELELGNWQYECSECKKTREKREQERVEKIKREGKQILRHDQIYAWQLGDETLFNPNWTFEEKENFKTRASNIDDIIREQRKRGAKSIVWNPYLYDILLYFVSIHSFGKIESPLIYMGIKHYEGGDGIYEFVVNET